MTTDPSEFNLFAGGTNGSIYQVHLYNPVSSSLKSRKQLGSSELDFVLSFWNTSYLLQALKEENHVDKETPLIFKGHK